MDGYVVGLGDAARVLEIDPRVLDQWATRGYIRFRTVPSAGQREFRRFGFSEISSLVPLAVFHRLGFDADVAHRIAERIEPRGHIVGQERRADIGNHGEESQYAVVVRTKGGAYKGLLATRRAGIREAFRGQGEALVLVDLDRMEQSKCQAKAALYNFVKSGAKPQSRVG